MAYKVRSGALNVFRKNSFAEQKQDVLRAMQRLDVLSLSEIHGEELLEWARDMGYGVVKSKGDTAIIYDAKKFEAYDQGSETLNSLEGPTGGMRSREAAYVLLRDKNTGEQFWQIAAHTTPPRQGPKNLRRRIRKQQYKALSELAQRLERKGGGVPVILSGDLNFNQPVIRGMDNATKGGVMHSLASGAGTTSVKKVGGMNSDHNLLVAEYQTGKKQKPIKSPDGRDRLDPQEIEREYGFGYQFFKSDPELWQLLREAIAEGYDAAQFQAHLRDTKWFKQHSDAWRQNMALKFTDPATYKERLQNARDQIENLAGQWGANLTNKEVSRYAERALLLGWSPEQILDHIARDVRPGKDGGYDGQLSGVQQQLESVAFRNGVKVPKGQLNGWMKAIVRGEAEVSEYEDYIRRLSAQSFSAFGKEIKAGVDLAEIASPYMQSMADILELNPNEINLFDRTIRKALAFRNEKGEAVPMSLTDFEDSLRADNRWQYTEQAKEQMTGYAVSLGKMFGVLS